MNNVILPNSFWHTHLNRVLVITLLLTDYLFSPFFLYRFLVDVAAKESNKMSPMGLAIVFGPNLFRYVDS